MPPGADVLADFSPLLRLGLLTIVGFYAGRLVRPLRLPSILGYMTVGLLAGPSVFELFRQGHLEDLAFINEIALGFVAFSVGAELSLRAVRGLGRGLVTIILAECLGTFVIVLLAVAALTAHLSGSADWPLALIFGAVACASAPAGTVAVIQEFRAKGSLTTALYAVVGFDDGLAILVFGFAYGMARALLPGSETGGMLDALILPVEEIVRSLVVGAALGFVFSLCVRRLRNPRDILILVFGFVLLGAGLSELWHMSLILTNMMVGFVLVNTRSMDLVRRVSGQLGELMPLIFVLFFAVAGAHLDLGALSDLGWLGIVYVGGRMLGKAGGASAGAALGGAEPKLRRYLGWGLHTQAGVAIGLALIVKDDFDTLSKSLLAQGTEVAAQAQRVGWIGTTVITTITATCILFEVIGPILAKMALDRAGEIPPEVRE